MTKVTIEDIRRAKDAAGKTWAVILLVDEAGRRHLPIWIGEIEATAIALTLRQVEMPRPLTVSLMASLLRAAGAEVVDVRVDALKGDVFIATVRLRTASGEQEVDARPSDAIALAAHTHTPIYASDEVLAAAGMEGDDYLEKARSAMQEKGNEWTWEDSFLSATFNVAGVKPAEPAE